jgi:hypothetical protein
MGHVSQFDMSIEENQYSSDIIPRMAAPLRGGVPITPQRDSSRIAGLAGL